MAAHNYPGKLSYCGARTPAHLRVFGPSFRMSRGCRQGSNHCLPSLGPLYRFATSSRTGKISASESAADEGPVPYPVACTPQGWSAAALFLLLQGCLGLTVSALERKISFTRPLLPAFLHQVGISNLVVRDAAADLLVVRHEDDVSMHVVGQTGRLEVVVLP